MNIRSHSGFSLLELLVALGISAIVAAFAIPQYQQYRKQAFDARALSDLQMVALAEEAHFAQNEEYVSCSGNSCTTLPGVSKLSEGTVLAAEATADACTITASHPKGTGKSYLWDSANGGLQ